MNTQIGRTYDGNAIVYSLNGREIVFRQEARGCGQLNRYAVKIDGRRSSTMLINPSSLDSIAELLLNSE